MTKNERVRLALTSLTDRQGYYPALIEVHRQYCDKNRYYDDTYHDMDDFDEFFRDKARIDLACLIHGEPFNPYDAWFKTDWYMHIESFASDKEVIEDIVTWHLDGMVNYIVDNNDWLGNKTLYEVLNYEGEEE